MLQKLPPPAFQAPSLHPSWPEANTSTGLGLRTARRPSFNRGKRRQPGRARGNREQEGRLLVIEAWLFLAWGGAWLSPEKHLEKAFSLLFSRWKPPLFPSLSVLRLA